MQHIKVYRAFKKIAQKQQQQQKTTKILNKYFIQLISSAEEIEE